MPSLSYDLTSSVAHEFGHATGFSGTTSMGHFNDDVAVCPVDYTRQTMCSGATTGVSWRRTLEPHDVHTFASVYGGTNSPCGPVMHGVIGAKWSALGGTSSVLGCATTEEYDTTDGRRQDFGAGSMWFRDGTGAYEVHGAIVAKLHALGDLAYGFPVTDETATPDGVGRYNHFLSPGGTGNCGQGANRSIYWHPSTGAHEVRDALRPKWCSLGWEQYFGYPTTDYSTAPDGNGHYQHFLKIGESATCGTGASRSIYSFPGVGEHEVHGAIRAKWCALGWEAGVLGYPITDELGTPDGVGRFNHFRKFNGTSAQYDGSIYASQYGQYEVHGVIRDKWSSMGWKQGILGYPVSDQESLTGGTRSRFAYGHIYSASVAGTHEIHGPILTRYLADNGPTAYGFPFSDVYAPATGGSGDQQVDFQSYSIRYVAALNQTVVCPVRCV